MAYVYILKCSDGSYYTGSASDVEKRIKTHVLKLPAAAKYTKSRGIEEVSAIWQAPSLSAAGKLEYYIKKKLTHAKKQSLVEDPELLCEFISSELLSLGFSFSHKISHEEIKNMKENRRK